MNRITSFITALAIYIAAVSAAQAYTLQGVIASAGNIPLPGASVVLFTTDNDSVPVAGTSCNEQGAYLLQADGGTYRLRASFIGMKTAWRDVTLSQDTRLDTIVMQTDTLLTQEVTVTAHFVKHAPNSITISMQGNPIARNSTAYNMLYKLPGMYGLTIYGRAVSKIYIDDQETDMNAATAMLKSLQAEDVESFELIPIANAEYGATTEGSVLRIKLKKKREDGANIFVYAQGKYPYEGKTVDSSYGVTSMAKIGKVESFTFIGFDNEHTWPTHSYSTRVYNDNTIVEAQSERLSGNRYNKLYVQQTLRYNINKHHMIGGRFHLSWHPKAYATSDILYTKNTTSLIFPQKSESKYETFYRYIQGYAYYTWLLDDRGSALSATFQYYRANQGNLSTYTSFFENDSTETIRSPYPTSYAVYYPSIQFVKQFANGMGLQIGFRYLHTDGDMSREETTTTTSHQNAITINEYKPYTFDEDLYSAYAQFAGSLFNKKLSYLLGLTVQHVDTRHRFSYNDPATLFRSTGVFPSVTLQYAHKNNYTSVTYSPYTNYPTGYNLNSTPYRTGTYSYWQGNPNLKAPYNHRLQLQQSLWNCLSFTLNGTWIVNPVASLYTIGDDRQTIYETLENFGNYDTYRLNVSFSKMVTKWLHINANGSTWCNYENSRQYGKHTYWSGSVNLSATAMLPKDWQIYIGSGFSGEERQYNVITYPHVSVNFYLQKSLLDDKLTLRLDVCNIPAMDITTRSDYSEYYLINQSNSYRMFAGISVYYSFDIGKKNVKVREVKTDGLAIERTQ